MKRGIVPQWLAYAQDCELMRITPVDELEVERIRASRKIVGGVEA